MAETSTCPNCEHAFGAARPRFCPACGQETNVKPPTLWEFAQQFGGAYVSTEGALWRTLKLLVLKPGELTRQYLAGRRKHYVLPLRLYLTLSLAVLLVLRLTMPSTGMTFNGPTAAELKREPAVVIDLGSIRVGLRNGVYTCTGLPASVCERLKRRLDFDPKVLERESAALGERFVSNLAGALFALVPAFALWMKLVYRNRRLRYTEHLVFALHLHAFWFPVLAVAITRFGLLSIAAGVWAPAYTLIAMKRVYGGRAWPRLLRAVVVFGLHFAAFVAVVAGAALWSFLF